ncbi:MAG: GEVED domain-containing protein [Saprospiraceae bacterium]|nr:GEVED domain-containing protein [Saprospiraceae bacterium]
MKSFFPVANVTIRENYLNAVNNTPPVPNYFLSWNSIAPSGIDYYNSTAIPNWQNSILVTSLKRRRVYRLQLDAAGTAIVSDTIPLFADFGRFRDVCISPDGTKIYVSCDSEGQTSGPTAGTTINPPNKGCILEFTYAPIVLNCAFNNCPSNQTFTPTGNTQVVTWVAPTLSNCSANATVSSNYASGAVFNVGTTTVTYTATSGGVAVATCSFTVTVNPVQSGVYCASKSSAPWNEWIGNVSLNTLSNTSEKTRTDRYVVGYSDWTDKTTTLSIGQSYPLSITPFASNIANFSQLFCRVWIDFDGDKTFEDNELVLERTNTNPLASTVFVFGAAKIGATRMRVSLKNGSYPTACESFANGEVEDYSIVIGSATSCVPPTIVCRDTTVTIAANLTSATVDVSKLSTLTTSANGCVLPSQSNGYFFIDGTQTTSTPTLPIGTTAIFRNYNYLLDGGLFSSAAICSSKVTVNQAVPPNTYCASKAGLPWEYAVSNVKLNTLNNTSEKFKDIATLGYSDYTSLSTSLNKGQNYPLSITPVLSWIGNLPNTYCRVWIDFNQNKTFEASELVLQKTNQNPFTQSVSIPTSALLGTTRMRVSLKNGSYPTACETFEKGEVEDYSVVIANGSVGVCNAQLKCPNDTVITITAALASYCGTLPNSPTVDLSNCPFRTSNLSTDQPTCLPVGTTFITWRMNFTSGGFSACTYRATVNKQTTSGTSDLALSIASDPSVYKPYTRHNFKITARNTGNTVFANVKIKFSRPALTNSGGTKTASIGTFQDYCPNGIECAEWTIPTLAGGATATLDAPVFVLNPTGSITATATLVSSTPTDNSTANNTASISVNPFVVPITQPLASRNAAQLIPIEIKNLYPSPTDSYIEVTFTSIVEKSVTFSMMNAMGQIVSTQPVSAEKGVNKAFFDVSALPQGVYLIRTNEGKGRGVPTKFIKL